MNNWGLVLLLVLLLITILNHEAKIETKAVEQVSEYTMTSSVGLAPDVNYFNTVRLENKEVVCYSIVSGHDRSLWCYKK